MNRYQAHRELRQPSPMMQGSPGPDWRWLAGAVAEVVVLLFAVIVVLLIASLQS